MRMPVAEVAVADVPVPLPPSVLVVDVREQYEWQAGHIDGAVHVPLMQVPRRLDDIPDDRPVLVVCRVGSRSAQATGFLQAHGRDAVNLAGGMVSWHRAGLPMVCDGDADARVV